MKNTSGEKSLIKKEDLYNVTCLKHEKSLLEKRLEESNEYLMHIIKGELLRERKIKKVKDKINEKENSIKKFLKNKKDGIKFIENERYQDNLNVAERQKLYEQIALNYDKKINVSKSKNFENKEKMEELKEQIKDYERKNKQYKKKIAEIFDLKDVDKDIKNNENASNNSDPENGRWKYINMEENKNEVNPLIVEIKIYGEVNPNNKEEFLVLLQKELQELSFTTNSDLVLKLRNQFRSFLMKNPKNPSELWFDGDRKSVV